MRRWTTFIGVVCVLAVGPACRADLLSGTVSYNSQTQLYTYSYTVTNTSSSGLLQEFDIRVGLMPATTPGTSALATAAEPVATTSPAGWGFRAAVLSSAPTSSPGLGSGTYWSWFDGAGIAPGATVSGFSFTTAAGPGALPTFASNYYAGFSAQQPSKGEAGLPLGWYGNPGQVLAPVLTAEQIGQFTSNAPEPSALLLGLSGFLALVSRVRRPGA